ncbi:FixH family protein [Nonomuraea monospora]|uniref:FixH family protein n=1 Tax=Nonomuraea monospora TaxID=568818 RepID=A0ABN3CG48_9ACTN
MKRWHILVAALLAAVAAALFVVGRSTAAGPITLTTAGTRYTATVLIPDPRPGQVTVEIQVSRGDADSVAVSAVMAEMGHSTPELTAAEREPGRFVAGGELFPMSGVWELTIRLDGPAGEEQLAVRALIPD